jgi:hypothetical protein
MSLTLPDPVANYFVADMTAGHAVAECFAVDAVVVDEGRTHTGREAIANWKAESSAKYDYVAEPVCADDRDGRVIVTAHLTGNFPGSSVDLRYVFTVSGETITRLEIAP